MIKAIIFDWGGVIIEEPSLKIASYCAKQLNVTPEAFLKTRLEYMSAFQRGHISEELFWRRVCDALGVGIPSARSLWIDAFKYAYTPQQEIMDLIEILKQRGYKLALLSTTEMPAVEYFRARRYGFFDAAVFSCLEGYVKPEEEIYQIVLERLGIKPPESIFIDDRQENVDGAQKLGINTIFFKNPQQLKEELHQYDIGS